MTKRWYFWCPTCGLPEGWSYNERQDEDLPKEPDYGCDCDWRKIHWSLLRLFKPDLPEAPIPGVRYEIKEIHTPVTDLITEAIYSIEIDRLDIEC